jgi:transposase
LRRRSRWKPAEGVLEPLLPPPSPGGRPPVWPMRAIVEAIFYVLRGGVPWRMLPKCFPPRQTVYAWFAAFRDAGVWEAMNHHLVVLDRERSGREATLRWPSSGFAAGTFASSARRPPWSTARA